MLLRGACCSLFILLQCGYVCCDFSCRNEIRLLPIFPTRYFSCTAHFEASIQFARTQKGPEKSWLRLITASRTHFPPILTPSGPFSAQFCSTIFRSMKRPST